jgi:hypothetical protein
MKKMLACLTILTATFAIPVMAANSTLTGVITDNMCGKGHMMPGKTDADCARECVKHGAHFAVVADGKVYLLAGKSAEISALAGKKVTVSGELKGDTMTVATVAAAH